MYFNKNFTGRSLCTCRLYLYQYMYIVHAALATVGNQCGQCTLTVVAICLAPINVDNIQTDRQGLLVILWQQLGISLASEKVAKILTITVKSRQKCKFI